MVPHGPFLYSVPPPPPPRKDRTVLIVLIVGAFALLVGIPFVVGVALGIRRTLNHTSAPSASTALTETYRTTNGLVAIHYPRDFAARKLDDSTLMITRKLGGGSMEMVTFAGLETPISDDPHELGRILLLMVEQKVTSKGGTFTKLSERPAMCLGKYPGIQIDATWQSPAAGAYESKSCFFVHNTHGYEIRHDVARARATAETPLLEQIEAATEIAP